MAQQRKRSTRNLMPLNIAAFAALSVLIFAVYFVLQTPTPVNAFIKFGYVLNTTACNICDELTTYSGRNVFCCLASSKCCGPNSLEELEASQTTVAPIAQR